MTKPELEDLLYKLKVEKENIQVKIINLTDFISSDKFKEITRYERGMLKSQLAAMRNYQHVLNMRIDYYKKELNKI